MAKAKGKNPAQLDMSNPITIAVAPLKEDAIEDAKNNARTIINRVTERLTEAENDLNKVIPHADSSRMSRADYMQARNRRALYESLVKSREGNGYRPSDPHFVDMDETRIEKFVKDAMDEAAAQYEIFVMKLCKKIGPVASATLHGNHVWDFSELTVIKADGTEEVWRTQQIDNVSCLGKWFPQWPTRKVKAKA